MLTNTDLNKVSGALKDKAAVAFTTEHLISNYKAFFRGREVEAEKVVKRAFQILTNSQSINFSLVGEHRLKRAVTQVLNEVIHNDKSSFWYSQLYQDYKSILKPRAEFDRLKPYIKGKKVLDFGSGKGYLSELIYKSGYQVSCADVQNYLPPSLSQLKFRHMSSPDNIPFDDNEFESVLVVCVLHHINKENLSSVLKELGRVAGRVIIVEDVSEFSEEIPGVKEQIDTQAKMRVFQKLSPTSKFHSCVLNDFFGNVIAQGITEMNLPFQFHSVKDWEKLMEANNFSLTHSQFLGFPKTHIHGFAQVILAFDRNSE